MIQQEIKGNLEVEITDNGILWLKHRSKEFIELVKANGYKGNFLLNAHYKIKDGVLYVFGNQTKYELVEGGDMYTYDDFSDQENIDEYLNALHIGNERIYTTEHRRWFGPNYTKRHIVRGYYMYKNTTPRSYKTSLFRVVEDDKHSF